MSTLHNVLPPASEMKFIGDEPTWDGTVKNYNSELLRGLNWHNYCASEKDYIKYMEQWIREHRPATAKQDIQLWRNLGSVNNSICAMARMGLQGFPLSATHSQIIRDYVMSFANYKKQVKKATPVASNKPNIQDRIKAQVSSVLSVLDGRIDDAFDGNIAPSDDIKGDILSKNFKAPQLKLVNDYLDNHITEWTLAYNKEDEQLAEGYSYLTKKSFKNIIDVFTDVKDSISQQKTKIQVQRIRKRKPLDKKKMASKVKFMNEFAELGLKSLSPVDIIGANVIWVYDTKKRKLGYYEGEAKDSLFIRGTMISGYKTTCVKTLRKPETQIKEIKSLRKNQTINWFDGIKAKCGTLNGRTNSNLILLRID